jgi:hypothetical protein
MHSFGADIPGHLWDSYERWARGRGKIDRRQLQRALFRLFLAAPEPLKMAALFGKGDKGNQAELRESLRAIVAEIVRVEREKG